METLFFLFSFSQIGLQINDKHHIFIWNLFSIMFDTHQSPSDTTHSIPRYHTNIFIMHLLSITVSYTRLLAC